jgi:thiamine kinase-like enzyme
MENLVTEITKKVFDCLPTGITEITGKGVVNSVYKVETPKGIFILRLQKGAENLKNFKKEKWATEKALVAGASTAPILEVGVHDDYAFSFQEFIEGDHAEEKHVDQEVVWEELGKIAKKLHGIKVEGFGENLFFEENTDGEKDWKSLVTSHKNRLFENDTFLKLEILSKEELEKIEYLIEEMSSWYVEPVLCHGNISPRNAIVGKNGKVFLIDWGTTTGHLPEREIAEVYFWNENEKHIEAFLRGYELEKEKIKEAQRKIDIISLIRAIDIAQWGIANKEDWKKENFVQSAIKKIKTILS